MRILLTLPVLTLVACGPQVPQSNPGPGFSDYSEYQRTQMLRQQQAQRQSAAIGTTGVPVSPPRATTPSALPPAPVGLAAPGAGAANPGISDEQSFSAVTARETIETDAARLAANAAAYQVVQPTAVPQRSGDVGPNIVQFALQTTNRVGQAIYERSYTSPSRNQSACASYASDDAAQRAFLASGGPQSDSRGLDPDGDGFACGWDPSPFRAASQGAPAQTAPVQTMPLPSAQ